jgi:16S rRNA (cytosine967-C5)-methyltransferase
MTPSARLAAVIELLEELFEKQGRAEQVLASYFKSRRYAGSKDRRWVGDNFYGILRRLGEVDALLDGADQPKTSDLRAVSGLILLGEETLAPFFEGPHAAQAPSEEVLDALVKEGGEAATAATGNFPEWIFSALQTQYGDKTAEICAAYQESAPITLRVNAQKAVREDILDILTEENIPASVTELSPVGIHLEKRGNLANHKLYREGLIEVQDEAAQIAALLTLVEPGLQVMDYCAGAGGKTIALGAQMDNQGQIFALDIDKRRMRDLAPRAKRAELHIVQPHSFGEGETPREKLEQALGKMNRVFVDAPCSGSGTWRRQPEQKWWITAERLEELQTLQQQILSDAAEFVADEGLLVYATCSIFGSENEAQIAEFLKNHPTFSVVPVSQIWEEAGLFGTWDEDYLSLTPNMFGTDGFFCAVLKQNS